jgi:serine protease Do
MHFKQILLVMLVSSFSAVSSVAVYRVLADEKGSAVEPGKETATAQYAKYSGVSNDPTGQVDFTKAASLAVPGVVHIKTKIAAKQVSGGNRADELLSQLLGSEIRTDVSPEQRASGSGVILSEDGYIVTNNHVVTDENGNSADEIAVSLSNRKTYKARLVGRDVNADIAVLKIEDKDLPHIALGNSDELQTGQWVLAIGYPFSLETTVTAGIISSTAGGKLGMSGRHVRENESAMQSYIQTDAAVNMGNSGGALVNTKGELIGINSAIISPTGTYAGYSFAIPVNVVKKSVGKIIKASGVQRRS